MEMQEYNFYDLLYAESIQNPVVEDLKAEARSQFFQRKEEKQAEEDARAGKPAKKKVAVVVDERPPETYGQKLRRAAPYIAGAAAIGGGLALTGLGVKKALASAGDEDDRKKLHLRRVDVRSWAVETQKAADTAKVVARALPLSSKANAAIQGMAEIAGSTAAAGQLYSIFLGHKSRPQTPHEERVFSALRDVRRKLHGNEDRLRGSGISTLRKLEEEIRDKWTALDDTRLDEIEAEMKAIRYSGSGAPTRKYKKESLFQEIYDQALSGEGAILESAAKSRIQARKGAAWLDDQAAHLRGFGKAGDEIAKNYRAAELVMKDQTGADKLVTGINVAGNLLKISPLLAQIASGVSRLLKYYGRPQSPTEEHAVEMLEIARAKLRDKMGYDEEGWQRIKNAIDLLQNDPENEVLIFNLDKVLYGSDRVKRKGPGRPPKR